MSDLISRQAALKGFAKYSDAWCYINALPTAEKKGEWIPVVDGNYILWECSECHVESDAWTDFCPICGSRNIEEMDEEAFEEALEEFRKNPKTYTLDEVEAELGLTAQLMLNNPITPEQWDLLEDVDFDHTDRIWFHTKHDKDVAFVKERKGKWIVHKSPDEYHCGLVECPFCRTELIAEPNEYCYCPNCGAKMENEDG